MENYSAFHQLFFFLIFLVNLSAGFNRKRHSYTGMVNAPDIEGPPVSCWMSCVVAGRFDIVNERRTSYQDVENSGQYILLLHPGFPDRSH